MKKLLLFALVLSVIVSSALYVSAGTGENTQKYEYIMPMEYTNIERIQNCYIAWDNREKCALYGLNGEKISDDYDYIGAFVDEQIASASKDGKYYVINNFGAAIGEFDGRIIDISDYILVNLTYSNEDGRPFSYYEGEFGVYTYTGELIKTLPYSKFNTPKNWGIGITFAGKRLFFKKNDKWGALDENFNVAIEPLYDEIYPFYNKDGNITVAIQNGKYGLIDKDGNIVADFVYDTINPLYNNGKINAYRTVQGETYMKFQGEKYGLFDKYGKEVKKLDELIPKALYDEYNLIQVCTKNTRSDSDEYGELSGLIDFDGNTVIPVENTNIWNISEGFITAQKSYDHCGYYDLKGNEITEFKYRMTSPFSDGLAFVSSCINDEWKNEVINTKGETVFNTSGWAGGFYGGIAEIETGKFIDENGNVVINNHEWETVSGLDWWSYKGGGTFIVSDGSRYGVVKYTKFISPWAKDAVDKAEKIKLINTDNNYNYTSPVTREDFCELIYNYLCNYTKENNTINIKNPFTDTDNAHIAILNSEGIINGKSPTEFAPNDYLTREEAATIIFRLINKTYKNWTTTDIYFEFADNTQISDWAMNGIQTLCNIGIMNGVENNKFAPQNPYTTEQAVATLVRVYNNFAETQNK